MIKSTTGFLPGIGLLRLFRVPMTRTILTWFTLLAFLHLTMGCNYYRLKQEEQVTAEKLAGIPNYKRFIVHHGPNSYELKNVRVQEEVVEGSLTPIPADLLVYVNPKANSSVRYKRPERGSALNIVHLHVFEYAQGAGDQVSIPLSALKRIDIADRDTGATVASHVLTTLGILAATYALLVVIILLTKSSCPYVYAHNGESYEFVGEAYGGAIFSPLERDDFMPLPRLRPDQGTYQVKIANELKERQYTNLAELLVAEHPTNVRVLLDRQGNPHTLQAVQPPLTALASDGQDYTPQLAATDSAACVFNAAQADFNRLHLQFRKPAGAREGKLVLHARNSLWLDYMFGEFTKQFGALYSSWAKQQKDVPAEEHNRWQEEQGIPLQVEVRTKQGWRKVEQLAPVGPLAGRDLVVPVNLTDTEGDLVEVRLTSGFMFWEIDQAGMDFSDNLPVRLRAVPPASAFDRDGVDNRALLTADNAQYLKQFNVGDEVVLTYPLPKGEPDQVLTPFLHTKGYYEHIRDYQGLPDILELKKFKQPGHFTRFSRDRYNQVATDHKFKHLTSAHVTTR
jgi:hypothetical protein